MCVVNRKSPLPDFVEQGLSSNPAYVGAKNQAQRRLSELQELAKPAPPAPDLTDEVIQATAQAESRKQQTGRTRRSTFMTGDVGTGKTLLGG